MGRPMSDRYYEMKISTLLNGADKLEADLEYLCALVEQPDKEFRIADAVVYARAVTAVTQQLDFIIEDLSRNELSEDEECVKLTHEEVISLTSYTENSEDALKLLEKICGISLQSN
jgi:hypothetical protein